MRNLTVAEGLIKEHRLTFTERVRLADCGKEISLTFEMRYQAVDAKALAAWRDSDPVERVRNRAAAGIRYALSQLPQALAGTELENAVGAVVERILPQVNDVAARYSLRILAIVVLKTTSAEQPREIRHDPGGKRALTRGPMSFSEAPPDDCGRTRESCGPAASPEPPTPNGHGEIYIDRAGPPKAAAASEEWLGQGKVPLPLDDVLGAVRGAEFRRELAQATLAGGRESLADARAVAAEAPKGDLVDCTVFSPHRVQPGGSVMVQVFVHLPLKEREAKELAKEFDAGTARRGFTSLEARLEEGARLTFRLDMAPLTVKNPAARLIWQGRTAAVQFSVKAPPECQKGAVDGKVTVRYEGVPIGHIRFTVEVCAAAGNDDRPTLTGSAHRYRKAFVSYASADRDEVLRRTQMLQALGIPYFQDVLDLKPGERWERELYRNIDDCDVFLLFWSKAARRSKWVLEEARYAMRRKGGDDDAPPHILPVIVGPPPPAEPPEDLAHIHFNDTLSYVMSAS